MSGVEASAAPFFCDGGLVRPLHHRLREDRYGRVALCFRQSCPQLFALSGRGCPLGFALHQADDLGFCGERAVAPGVLEYVSPRLESFRSKR